MIIIQFVEKGMGHNQTISIGQTTRTVFMWSTKFEVRDISKK
jgi:hypothetical protein